jgi:ribosome assembly protein YihI (activator of Der GTPase)
MITEKQVVQYLKNKDQDYIDNLLERIKILVQSMLNLNLK